MSETLNIHTTSSPNSLEKYCRTLIESSVWKSKHIWSNTNCIIYKKHNSIITTINLSSIDVTEPEITANAFISYFNSIPITLSDNVDNNLIALLSSTQGDRTPGKK